MNWRAHGADKRFDRESIFEYEAGGGELYNAYDFEGLTVREYRKPRAATILLELYRMGSSTDAFGLFCFDSEGERVGLGAESAYAAGALTLWKGRGFVRIVADRETEEAKQAILALGGKVAGALVGQSRRPALLKAMPEQGLLRDTVRYFHTPMCLNHHYYVSDANILGLSRRTNAVLAQYDVGGDNALLLVVRYPDAAGARRAHKRFLSTYLEVEPGAADAFTIRPVENDEHVGAALAGKSVVIVFGAGRSHTCTRLLSSFTKPRR